MSISRDEEKKKKPSILGAALAIGKQPGSPAKRMENGPAQTVNPGVQAKTPLVPTVNVGKPANGRGKIASVKTVFDTPAISPQPKIRTAAEMVADIYKIGQTDRAYSDQLMTMFEAERRNKASIYYNPYTAPTNTMALESLAELGVDVSQGIDDNFFQSYAWLKNNQRTGISGTPLAPTKSSSREESASYYYNKLLEAEDTTRKVEAEWDELRQKAAYLAQRNDRNYSDEEIVKLLNVEKNYPTLAKLDRERAAGTPVQLNRGVGYSQDSIYGAIWAGRGNESSGDSFVDAVNAKLGRGTLYAPNNQIKKRLNPESQEYNPYLLGSTIDDEAALFGMSSFSKAWLDQNAGAVMANGTEDQQRAFQRIYDAEIRTKAAEDEIKDFFSKPEAKIISIAKSALSQGMTADEAIREYMSRDYSTIGNLIDGLDRRQPVGITRKLDFDYHALRAQVDKAMAVEHARETDIAAAQDLEYAATLAADGDATEDDLAPKSKTASRGGLGAFTQGTVTFLTDAGKAVGDLVGGADKPSQAPAKKPDGPKAPAGYKSDNQSVINRIMTEAKEKGWKRIEDVPFGKRMIETIVKGNPYFDREMEQYFLMKDNEVEQYNYLFDKQGEAAANDYFRGLQKERLNKDYRAYWDNEAKKFANENPVGASLATVANSFVGAAEGITTLFDDLILGNEISKDDIRLSSTGANTTIRGTVSENINDPTWNFLYQSGMSIADSLSRMALGAAGQAVTMFGASSASTVDEMLSQGATREQAWILGGVSGVLETVMERAGMNRLTGMIKGVGGKGAKEFFKGIVRQGVKNMVPELAEELATEIGNTAADILVRGEDSEPMQLHRYFQSEGMTSEQAWDAVGQTIGGNFAMAGAGGAFSGFVFGNIGNIAQSFNARMNGAAAVQSFKALNEAGDVQNAGGQVLAAQVASQVVNSHSIDQMNDPKIKKDLAPYNAKIAEAMGIDQALADSVAGKIVSKGSVKTDKTLLAGVRALAQMPEKNQVRTIKAVTAKPLSLAEVQTLAKINMLKNASTSQNKSEQVDALVNDALVKATDQTVQALGVSGMPENTVKFAQERWGTEGVLYLGNLLQSEDQTAQRIAVALQTMPTYAQAVIVAEENMKSVTLTPDAVAKQIEAFTADALNPEIMDNASDRAISQAVEVKVSAVLAEASPEVKAVERAASKVKDSQALFAQAMAEGDAAAQALKAAAEQFLATPEDKTAANAYTSAQAALKRSKDKVTASKRVLAADENNLSEAEKTLEERQVKARAEAEAQATQEVLQSAQAAQVEQEAQAVQEAPLKQTNGQVIPDNFESYADEFVAENYADASDDVKTDIKQRFIDTTNKRLGRKPLDLNSPAYGEKNRNFMAQVEKKFGVSISLDANIADGTEAWFSPETNEIKINPNMTADNALIGVVMHELTHLAEESGWYDEYKEAALTLKYGDDYAGNANYQRDIDAKIKRYADGSITLTPDQAIAEIVAEETRRTIFADENAVRQFVEREPNLARRILAALNDIIQSMRQLVGGDGVTTESKIDRARVLLEMALNERADRLSPDRQEGIERYNNLREGVQQDLLSQIQYSLKDVDPKYLNYKENMDTVTEMETVAQLTGDEFSKGPIDLLTQVTKFFDSIGNEIKNPALGSVLLTESGIRSSIGHKMGRKKAIAFAAVPKIIENGQIIYAKENWKGREYDSAVIAAPIAISNERYYAGVVVRLLSDRNSYYVHEVLIEKGTSLPLKTGTPAQGDGETSDKDHPSVVSLLQQVKDVKKEDAAIKSEKKYSLIDKDTDTAYLEAVNAGDMDAAQKMVDEAAKAAGYSAADGYRMAHRAPVNDGLSKPIYDMTAIYPKDFYEHGVGYYGSYMEGVSDHQAMNKLKYVRGNPDKLVAMYRAVPADVKESKLRNGDWIAITRDYAQIHGKRNINGPYRIIKDVVPAKHIYTNADSLQEYGYDDGENYAYRNTRNNKKLLDPVTYDDYGRAIPLSRRFNNRSNDIRYSLSDQDTEKINKAVDELLRKFGAIPQGEKVKNTAEIPVKTSDELTTRKHVRTVSEADILDIAGRNELNRKIVAEHFSYEPISDDEAMAYAAGMDSGELERVWRRSIEGDAIPGKRQIATGERLLVQYAEAGETDSAMRMIAELSEVLTRAGQTVQAARLLKKTTNAGALHYIKRAIDKLNEGIKGEGVKLNPDLVNDLTQAKTPQERDAAIKAIQKDAGQQIPPNWKTRLNAWRYFAMLGNPRTHIRNIVGNAIFMPAVKIKNMIGAGIEAATGQDRTKSVVLDRGLRRAAMQDAEEHMDELMGGGKYNPAGEIEQFKRSFGDSSFGKGMEALTEFNSALLEKEDGIFLKRHYANALAGYLQANGMTLDDADETALTKARQYAVDEAKKATYRDASAVAEYINKAAKKGGMWELMVEGIMPFKKTPINILKRGVEYSPIGLIETGTRGLVQLRSGKITPTQFIDKISAGMTGTMIAGLGLFLNSLGLIRIGGGDDKEEEFERQGGAQNYSIEIAGYSITLDWMTPASMPLFVGASLGKLMEEEQQSMGIAETLNAGFQALQGLMEPMFSLSILSGVDQAIQSAALNQENAITAIMVNSSLNYAGQFVPTLLGQVARTLDPERRRIYTDKNIPLDSNIQRFIEQQQNKLPWISTKNEPYIDIWGEAEKSGSGWLRALENFISPAYINELTPDAVEDLLLEVYRQTGDDRVLPASASKYFTVNGQRIDLDSKQYTDFSIARGKTMRSGLESMMADPRFAQADMQIKAGLIRDMVDYSTQIAKSKISDEFAMTGWMKEAKTDPVDAIFKRVEEADYEAKRKNYRTSAMEAALTGDYDSLEAATGALMQAHISKNPDATDKQALSAAKRYLNDQAKAAYITAYQDEDEELMERIEDSFYDVGIVFNYRDWLKDNE